MNQPTNQPAAAAATQPATKKIKFTANAEYETDGRHQGQKYKAGEVHEMREDLAQRWIRRGVAVAVDKEASTLVSAAPKSDKPAADSDAAAGARDKAARESAARDKVAIPADWANLSAADLHALALSLGADEKAVNNKAAATEFVQAEVKRRESGKQPAAAR